MDVLCGKVILGVFEVRLPASSANSVSASLEIAIVSNGYASILEAMVIMAVEVDSAVEDDVGVTGR